MNHYLFASDFDETLSLHDSGIVLSQIVGISEDEFRSKVRALARLNLVQQGGELAYLLGHDPGYRRSIRREHLLEAGSQIQLKEHVREFFKVLSDGVGEFCFVPFVISAAPAEIVRTALAGLLPADHICGTSIQYDSAGGIEAITQVPAGFGKVAVLDRIQSEMGLSGDRIIYVGDGSSDLHVMLHVNRREGFTISVSEARHVSRIARRTVLSQNALSVLVPILEEVLGWECTSIRAFFDSRGFVIQDWDRVRTDWLTIRGSSAGRRLRAAEIRELRHA